MTTENHNNICSLAVANTVGIPLLYQQQAAHKVPVDWLVAAYVLRRGLLWAMLEDTPRLLPYGESLAQQISSWYESGTRPSLSMHRKSAAVAAWGKTKRAYCDLLLGRSFTSVMQVDRRFVWVSILCSTSPLSGIYTTPSRTFVASLTAAIGLAVPAYYAQQHDRRRVLG